MWTLQNSPVLKDALASIEMSKLVVADIYSVSRVVQLCEEESNGRFVDIVLDFDLTCSIGMCKIIISNM